MLVSAVIPSCPELLSDSLLCWQGIGGVGGGPELEEDPLRHTEAEDTTPNPACVHESLSFFPHSWTTFAINHNNLSLTKYTVTDQSGFIDGIQCPCKRSREMYKRARRAG